jgi:hypothetical protein
MCSFFPTKREQTHQVFKSVLFSVAKCPSDYVKNVVNIAVCINGLWFMIAFILVFWYVRKIFVILGKIIICPEKFLYVCEDNDMSRKFFRCPFLSKSAPLNRPPPKKNFLMLPTSLLFRQIKDHNYGKLTISWNIPFSFILYHEGQ